MLVLARQLNERILLPTVPASIEVVAVKPNGVRLGIEAPSHVTILREEVLRRAGLAAVDSSAAADADANLVRRLQSLIGNRLSIVALSLDLLRQQARHDEDAERETMVRRLENEVRQLDDQLRELFSNASDGMDAPQWVRRDAAAASC